MSGERAETKRALMRREASEKRAAVVEALRDEIGIDIPVIPQYCPVNGRGFYSGDKYLEFFNSLPPDARRFFLPIVIEERCQRLDVYGAPRNAYGMLVRDSVDLTAQEYAARTGVIRSSRHAKQVLFESFTTEDVLLLAWKARENAMKGNFNDMKIILEQLVGRPDENLYIEQTFSLMQEVKALTQGGPDAWVVEEIDAVYSLLEEEGDEEDDELMFEARSAEIPR